METRLKADAISSPLSSLRRMTNKKTAKRLPNKRAIV
jgi:hypothetical protein